jgi:hypothetical protein
MNRLQAYNQFRAISPPLAFAFGCACVADWKPDLFYAAAASALLAMAAQVAFIIGSGKRLSRGMTKDTELQSQDLTAEHPRTASIADVGAALAAQRLAAAALRGAVAESYVTFAALGIEHGGIAISHQLKRLQPSVGDEWALFLALQERAHRRLSTVQANSPFRNHLSTRNNWRILDYAPDIFNVDAGAFEIEHISGQTVIRIRDHSTVKVEDAIYERDNGMALKEFSGLAEAAMRSSTKRFSPSDQ